MTRVLWIPAAIVLLIALVGCGQDAAESSVDWEHVGPLYENIEAHHARIMARYEQMAADMPDSLRHRYEEMQQLYEEMAPMHDYVMHGGPMGGPMMGSGTEIGHMDPARMHALDQHMQAMHLDLADDLSASGMSDMAAMHEMMAEYYDEVMYHMNLEPR